MASYPSPDREAGRQKNRSLTVAARFTKAAALAKHYTSENGGCVEPGRLVGMGDSATRTGGKARAATEACPGVAALHKDSAGASITASGTRAETAYPLKGAAHAAVR